MVIQLSSAIKSHIEAHPLSAELRSKIGKVTSATQEFVILLHVSSFFAGTNASPLLAYGSEHCCAYAEPSFDTGRQAELECWYHSQPQRTSFEQPPSTQHAGSTA